MEAATDTRERILEAAEDLLRRFGPEKTNVVDVARALGMSHANVYRHFASKAALMDRVAERWLHRISEPLEAIVSAPGDAEERLKRWFSALIEAKRAKVGHDPELFATYHRIAENAREVVAGHVAELEGQIARIVADGVSQGRFAACDPDATAKALFAATAVFHHPHFVLQDPAGDRDPGPVIDLLIAGLKP